MVPSRLSTLRHAGLAAAFLILAGCATPDGGPAATAQPAPQAPAPLPPAKPATIVGSEESSMMFDNFTAFVAAIDNKPVPAGRAGWKTPLALEPGQRLLTVMFVRGVFTAHADIPLQARSEAAYEVKFTSDAQLFGQSTYCEFWIVDSATGEKVVTPVRAQLTRVQPAGAAHPAPEKGK
jgi:hypothetical protein